MTKVYIEHMVNNFDGHALKVMERAHYQARRMAADELCTDHILLGLLDEPTGMAFKILEYHVSPSELKHQIQGILPGMWHLSYFRKASLSNLAINTIEFARREAYLTHAEQIGSVHLLLGLLHEQQGRARTLLSEFGLDRQIVLDMAELEG